jgi:hypothetical protein
MVRTRHHDPQTDADTAGLVTNTSTVLIFAILRSDGCIQRIFTARAASSATVASEMAA